jgi:hypothetical protein
MYADKDGRMRALVNRDGGPWRQCSTTCSMRASFTAAVQHHVFRARFIYGGGAALLDLCMRSIYGSDSHNWDREVPAVVDRA